MTEIWKMENNHYPNTGLFFRRIEIESERFYQGKCICPTQFNKIFNFEKKDCRKLEDWEIVKLKLQGIIKL